jgi:hypothetical protein
MQNPVVSNIPVMPFNLDRPPQAENLTSIPRSDQTNQKRRPSAWKIALGEQRFFLTDFAQSNAHNSSNNWRIAPN